jgi:adenylylsulfate kinase
MSEPKSKHITWHAHTITKEDRAERNGHKGAVLWFTGLSGSGKSTVANAVESMLYDDECVTFVLDGDNVRHGLNKDLGFSPEDRTENIRRIGEVAKLFADAGVLVCTAFISPYIKDRNAVRDVCADGEFIEIMVDCPLDECEKRDPKGLYEKARAGIIPEFTGISAPYEAPENPEITVNTGDQTIEESTLQVIQYLRDNGYIQ